MYRANGSIKIPYSELQDLEIARKVYIYFRNMRKRKVPFIVNAFTKNKERATIPKEVKQMLSTAQLMEYIVSKCKIKDIEGFRTFLNDEYDEKIEMYTERIANDKKVKLATTTYSFNPSSSPEAKYLHEKLRSMKGKSRVMFICDIMEEFWLNGFDLDHVAETGDNLIMDMAIAQKEDPSYTERMFQLIEPYCHDPNYSLTQEDFYSISAQYIKQALDL